LEAQYYGLTSQQRSSIEEKVTLEKNDREIVYRRE
jgi:hypothetical protein